MTLTAQPSLKRALLASVERLNNSQNGNPRFEIIFTGPTGLYFGTHRTMADAAINYEVSNFYNAHTLVDVWLTRRGSVEFMRPSEVQS